MPLATVAASVAATVAATVALISPARALPAQTMVQDAPAWTRELTGAAWLMGMRGTVRPSEVAQTATMDASSNRALESDDATAYVSMRFTRDRFVLAGDLSDFRATDEARTTSGDAASISQRSSALTMTPGFVWLRSERGSLELFGGVRVWRMNATVAVPDAGVSDNARTSYYDVVFAARGEQRVTRAITASLYADAGGFAVASDLTWQLAGRVAYRAADAWSVVAGYRHLSVNYRGDGKRLDLDQYGPTLGAALHF